MNIDLAIVARDLKLPPEKVERTVELLDQGNTIPFITRFRKDQTGGLNEEEVLSIKKRVTSLRALGERKAFVLKSIESQSKLTEELRLEIDKATTSRRLEDLYHPFKAKKQSRAQTARHQGLEPLADSILSSTAAQKDMSEQATSYVRVDKGLSSVDDVIKGVGDLLAERFSESTELRSKLRKLLWEEGALVSKQVQVEQNQPAKKDTKKKAGGEAPNEVQGSLPFETQEATASSPVAVAATASAAADPAPASEAPKPEEKVDTATAESSAPESDKTDTGQSAPDEPTAGDAPPEADGGTTKTTCKMSAADSDPQRETESASADPAKEKPKVSELKPEPGETATAKVVVDPAAEKPVVTDKPKEADKPTATEKPTEKRKRRSLTIRLKTTTISKKRCASYLIIEFWRSTVESARTS